MKLIDILQNRTVSELKEQCASYRLTRYSKLKKAELAQLLSETMLSDDFLERMFLTIDEAAFRGLEKLQKKKAVSAHDILPFVDCRLAFKDENGQVELVDEMQSFNLKRFDGAFYKRRKEVQKYRDYLIAFANFYGILPYREMTGLLHSYESAAFDEEELIDICDMLDMCGQSFTFMDDRLVTEALAMEPEFYGEILRAQCGKPYARLPKAELLKYTDDSYFEKTPQYFAVAKFFQTVFHLNPKFSAELTADIVGLIQAEAPFSTILEYMDDMGCRFTQFDEDVVLHFMSLYTDLRNNTRIWYNCGHTPNAMARIQAGNNR